MLQFLPQLGRFVKEQGAIGLDPISIISSQQTRHWLVANLAHQVPERNINAADGVLDGAAAPLPEGALPQALADATGFVGALADQHGPQQLHGRLDQGLAGHRAADADQPFVGDDFDDGVDVLFRLQIVDPAALDGAARQSGDTQLGDFHTEPRTLVFNWLLTHAKAS